MHHGAEIPVLRWCSKLGISGSSPELAPKKKDDKTESLY